MSAIREVQSWSAEGYARNARFVADLGQPVLDLLAPRPGERILDLGCGDGALTAKLAAAGAEVVGADSSAELVAAARALGLDARIADGQALPFAAEFDAVFSNAALHWMPKADAVIAGVRRALKPGGRFVGEFGGHGNVAAIVTALVAALNARGLDGAARVPWFFPTPAEYAAKLEAQGFRVDTIGLVPRPTPLPTGMRGWLDTFANPLLDGIDGPARSALLDEVEALLAPSLRDQAGQWTADYVRLRFAATLAS
ncbi:class I SAM-dependent methyltransferase [Inquilinus limosus]|uniref:class I SAM-dependent methyltransferase n=1 Tax=Inquilinus limosus TaxID=171674 RepID=UPI00040A0AED|nr:class I SAM-dependent methyltransferase [Inquilinus limosus]